MKNFTTKYFITMFIFLLALNAYSAPTKPSSEEGISIVYTKMLLNYYGLCINAALSLGVAGLSVGSIAILKKDFKKRCREVALGENAADNPYHVLGVATATATTIFFTNQALQNFINAVQQWYILPANITN